MKINGNSPSSFPMKTHEVYETMSFDYAKVIQVFILDFDWHRL